MKAFDLRDIVQVYLALVTHLCNVTHPFSALLVQLQQMLVYEIIQLCESRLSQCECLNQIGFEIGCDGFLRRLKSILYP
jgi:hypothetical protein